MTEKEKTLKEYEAMNNLLKNWKNKIFNLLDELKNILGDDISIGYSEQKRIEEIEEQIRTLQKDIQSFRKLRNEKAMEIVVNHWYYE